MAPFAPTICCRRSPIAGGCLCPTFRSIPTLLVGSLALLATAFLPETVQGQSAPDIMKATLAQASEKTAEVSTDELRRMLADGSATVFDARPHLEFAISHIPGALNVAPKAGVPMSLYVSDIAEIGRILGEKKDAAIVLYCNGPFCGKSKRLAEELTAAGYTNVRRYQLGAPVWRALVGRDADRAGRHPLRA